MSIKTTKQCPHANIVQVGGETEIKTICTDCNEVIKIEKNGKNKSKGV